MSFLVDLKILAATVVTLAGQWPAPFAWIVSPCHIEKIPPIPMRWPKEVRGALRLSATLEERRSDALLYRQLATLRLDAPVAATLEEMRFTGVPRAAFHSWCEALGAADLRDRPTRWATE